MKFRLGLLALAAFAASTGSAIAQTQGVSNEAKEIVWADATGGKAVESVDKLKKLRETRQERTLRKFQKQVGALLTDKFSNDPNYAHTIKERCIEELVELESGHLLYMLLTR